MQLPHPHISNVRDFMARPFFLDRDEIDLDQFFGNVIFHTVPPHCEEESLSFGRGEALDRTPVGDARPVLDLEKDGRTVFFSDDVDLASFGRDEIRLDDAIVVSLEIVDGYELASVADGAIGIGHETGIRDQRLGNRGEYLVIPAETGIHRHNYSLLMPGISKNAAFAAARVLSGSVKGCVGCFSVSAGKIASVPGRNSERNWIESGFLMILN